MALLQKRSCEAPVLRRCCRRGPRDALGYQSRLGCGLDPSDRWATRGRVLWSSRRCNLSISQRSRRCPEHGQGTSRRATYHRCLSFLLSTGRTVGPFRRHLSSCTAHIVHGCGPAGAPFLGQLVLIQHEGGVLHGPAHHGLGARSRSGKLKLCFKSSRGAFTEFSELCG